MEKLDLNEMKLPPKLREKETILAIVEGTAKTGPE